MGRRRRVDKSVLARVGEARLLPRARLSATSVSNIFIASIDTIPAVK